MNITDQETGPWIVLTRQFWKHCKTTRLSQWRNSPKEWVYPSPPVGGASSCSKNKESSALELRC